MLQLRAINHPRSSRPTWAYGGYSVQGNETLLVLRTQVWSEMPLADISIISLNRITDDLSTILR